MVTILGMVAVLGTGGVLRMFDCGLNPIYRSRNFIRCSYMKFGTDRQTNRQINTQAHRHTDRYTDRQYHI